MYAQTAVLAVQDESRGAIDQLVSIGFEPIDVFLLKEAGVGKVKKYPAAFVSAAKHTGEDARAEGLLVGTQLPMQDLDQRAPKPYFSFFLLGKDGMFAATPVRNWSRAKIIENAKSEQVLKVEIEEMRRERIQVGSETERIESDLRALRDRASRVAGIDELISLKTEVSRLKSFGEENTADRKQLKHLLNLAQMRKEPEGIDERRFALSQDLREVALLTADADRLSRQRQSAAEATVQDKLALLRETASSDPTALAQEVVRLRTRRKELERRLGVNSDKPADF